MIKISDVAYLNERISEEIQAAIMSVVKENSFVRGEQIVHFENAFAEYIGTKFCLGVANGTDALEIAIAALDLPKGSEVILPDNTFVATAEAVINMGLKPVIADVTSAYTIDVESVEGLINQNTSAIVPVHLYGNLAPMDEVMHLAKKHGLAVIEDAAQAHGSLYQNRRAGSIGNIGCFSFYPGKNLGAFGDAGAIVTNDEDLATKVLQIRDHGRVGKDDHVRCGRNSRLDTIQAAVLYVKLKYLETWLVERIKVAERYDRMLKEITQVQIVETSSFNRHTYHQYVIRCKRRNELLDYLRTSGIECGIHYPRTVSQQVFIQDTERCREYRSREYAQQILSLPIGIHLSEEQQTEIVNRIKEFYR